MSAHLFRLLSAASRHWRVSASSTAAVAALALVGGVLTGAGQAPAIAAPGATAAPAVTVAPGRRSVDGIVRDVRPQGFSVYLASGRTVLVRTDAATVYRRGKGAVARAALQPGQRVVVLGRVQPNGRLRARAVAIRAERPPRPAITPAAAPSRPAQ